MPLRTLDSAEPFGFGLATCRQAVPFQCSTRVWGAAAPLRYPAAQTLRADVPPTPLRKLMLELGFGLLNGFHAVPFQCRTRLLCRVPVGSATPTAQALVAEITVT